MARHTRGSMLQKGYAGKSGMSSDHPKMADMGRGKVKMPRMMTEDEMGEMMEGKKAARKGGKFAKKGK